jgi:hypothetical protein
MDEGAVPIQQRVIYLVGAGATQGEVTNLGIAKVNLLMRDSEVLGEGVSNAIIENLAPGVRAKVPASGDVEKVISLLESSGMDELEKLAVTMRGLYFNEIRDRLVRAGVHAQGRLAEALFALHKDEQFTARTETLTAVLTTNHDGLLQNASQSIFGAVNLGFPFTSTHLICDEKGAVPPVLQLHGSFTWTLGKPLSVMQIENVPNDSSKAVWIPPTTAKESKRYPFNKIIGYAYELLVKECDVLRIVGSSLTQNDWNILSLIFNAQRHRQESGGSAFRIELIMPPSSAKYVKEECAYLDDLISMNALTDGDFSSYNEALPPDSDQLLNPYKFWLKTKIVYHTGRDEIGRETIDGVIRNTFGEIV